MLLFLICFFADSPAATKRQHSDTERIEKVQMTLLKLKIASLSKSMLKHIYKL
jgi:hypothetical protein